LATTNLSSGRKRKDCGSHSITCGKEKIPSPLPPLTERKKGGPKDFYLLGGQSVTFTASGKGKKRGEEGKRVGDQGLRGESAAFCLNYCYLQGRKTGKGGREKRGNKSLLLRSKEVEKKGHHLFRLPETARKKRSPYSQHKYLGKKGKEKSHPSPLSIRRRQLQKKKEKGGGEKAVPSTIRERKSHITLSPLHHLHSPGKGQVRRRKKKPLPALQLPPFLGEKKGRKEKK